MVFLLRRLAFVGLLLVSCLQTSAAIQIERITTNEQVRFLLLKGTFEFSDDANALVREVIDFRPAFVSFDSGGGNIDAAERFGRMLRALRLATLQLRSFECASACTLVFMGGVQRFAEAGAIGVHQSSFASDIGVDSRAAVSAVQSTTAEIMAYMIEMGVDPQLLQLSLTVDSSDMRYLTTTEMRKYRVTTDDDFKDVASASADETPSRTLPSDRVDVAAPAAEQTASIDTEASVPAAPSASPDIQRPSRMAIYNGLDFMGRDIGSAFVSDASSCAMQCLSQPSCKAFTFNTRTRSGRGPNCFTKSSQGQLDGNSAAVSGMLLGRLDPEPQTMTFGAIDPNTNLYKDVDIPGFDLSRRPATGVQTQLDCRMACVNDGRCAAFTFVAKKKECWLKSGVGPTRVMTGAVTGAKTPMTYAPNTVSLN